MADNLLLGEEEAIELLKAIGFQKAEKLGRGALERRLAKLTQITDGTAAILEEKETVDDELVLLLKIIIQLSCAGIM